jgi:hypothetical protein
VGGREDGWMDGWVEVKAVLRIAYSNKKISHTPEYGEKISSLSMPVCL